jgi:hypothetical protein
LPNGLATKKRRFLAEIFRQKASTDSNLAGATLLFVDPSCTKEPLMSTILRRIARSTLFAPFAAAVVLVGCGGDPDRGSDGPMSSEAPVVHATGNVANGRTVFRFETFGNERFWTDALRLQQGMVAAGVTPLKALQLGLVIDSDAIDAGDAGGDQGPNC